eukprot:6461648-Amphidinium_carterae.1
MAQFCKRNARNEPTSDATSIAISFAPAKPNKFPERSKSAKVKAAPAVQIARASRLRGFDVMIF